MNIGPIVAACLTAAGLLFGGHYAFQPPRSTMGPPYTYVYGVGSCLIGLALYCFLVGSWAVSFWLILALFTVCGLLVWALYQIDAHTEARLALHDARDEVATLRRLIGREEVS